MPTSNGESKNIGAQDTDQKQDPLAIAALVKMSSTRAKPCQQRSEIRIP